jgi:hypothetical protein
MLNGYKTTINGMHNLSAGGQQLMHMDRAIFDLNASVEATSLYILICALLDQQELPTLKRAKVQWNGSGENLMSATEELMRRGVLQVMHPLRDDEPLRVNPRHEWDLS